MQNLDNLLYQNTTAEFTGGVINFGMSEDETRSLGKTEGETSCILSLSCDLIGGMLLRRCWEDHANFHFSIIFVVAFTRESTVDRDIH